MAKQAGIGIIGCGNISEAYLRLAPGFANLKVVAVADIAPAAAKARAEQFGLRALTVDELLRDESISTVINLTIPAVHYDVSRSILSAGKNAYSEKPLALDVPKSMLLHQAQHDSSVMARVHAVQALGRIGGADVVRALSDCVKSQFFWGVSVEAARALAAIGTSSAQTGAT